MSVGREQRSTDQLSERDACGVVGGVRCLQLPDAREQMGVCEAIERDLREIGERLLGPLLVGVATAPGHTGESPRIILP